MDSTCAWTSGVPDRPPLAPLLRGSPFLRPLPDVSPGPQGPRTSRSTGVGNPDPSASWWARCLVTPRSSAISASLIGAGDRRVVDAHIPRMSSLQKKSFAPTSRSSAISADRSLSRSFSTSKDARGAANIYKTPHLMTDHAAIAVRPTRWRSSSAALSRRARTRRRRAGWIAAARVLVAGAITSGSCTSSSQSPHPFRGATSLRGVSAVSARNVWAVGNTGHRSSTGTACAGRGSPAEPGLRHQGPQRRECRLAHRRMGGRYLPR